MKEWIPPKWQFEPILSPPQIYSKKKKVLMRMSAREKDFKWIPSHSLWGRFVCTRGSTGSLLHLPKWNSRHYENPPSTPTHPEKKRRFLRPCADNSVYLEKVFRLWNMLGFWEKKSKSTFLCGTWINPDDAEGVGLLEGGVWRETFLQRKHDFAAFSRIVGKCGL